MRQAGPVTLDATYGRKTGALAATVGLGTVGLTNIHYRMPDVTSSELPREALQVLWRVQEEFLNAALKAVDADFGGVQHYLVNKLRVGPREQARLAELYLQP